MTKDKKSNSDSFGLNEPTGQFDDLDKEMKRRWALRKDESRAESDVAPADDISYKLAAWKGFDEEEEEEFEHDVAFEKKKIPEDELDMTPMVDVTFLLLIFFMVTASFTLQKSLEQPHTQSEDPSTQVSPDEKIVDEHVQITIDQTNTFYVTRRDADEVECPSDSEMRARVKDAKDASNATRLIIVAHVDSIHAKVITAWDAGVVNDMDHIEIQTTDEDY